MCVFVYCIAADISAPPEGTGYVCAETVEEAVALVWHLEVNVYPLPADAEWPGGLALPSSSSDDSVESE